MTAPLPVKDRAHQLRRALFWAASACEHWASATKGLKFDAILPSFAPARLQARTRSNGSCLVSIDDGILRLLHIEVTHNLSLALPLPDHILKFSPGAVRGALLAAPTGNPTSTRQGTAAAPFLIGDTR